MVKHRASNQADNGRTRAAQTAAHDITQGAEWCQVDRRKCDVWPGSVAAGAFQATVSLAVPILSDEYNNSRAEADRDRLKLH